MRIIFQILSEMLHLMRFTNFIHKSPIMKLWLASAFVLYSSERYNHELRMNAIHLHDVCD